jgi:hypothetical protein
MFDRLEVGGTPPDQGFPLQTRSRVKIPNEQAAPPDAGQIMAYHHLVAANQSVWEQRKDACGVYNCAGHVWASRRTSIYLDRMYQEILDEEYTIVPAGQSPKVGDLAVYRDRPSTPIFHIGMVMELRKLVIGNNVTTTPWVLSKMSDAFGEVLHPWNNYDTPGHTNPHVSFWTDKS